MAASFSEGLLTGFSVLETMRDRKEARANEARRLSLAELADARQGQAFDIQVQDHTRALARQDEIMRAGQARARILKDPDNADESDLLMLEQFDPDSAAQINEALYNRRGQRDFAASTLSDLAARAQAAPSPGGAVPGEQSGPSGRAQQYSPAQDAQDAFLAPSADSELPPEPRRVSLQEVAPYLDPKDPMYRDPELPQTLNSVAAQVAVPPGVKGQSEILAMPFYEQEAAIRRNKELLGNRASDLATRDAQRPTREAAWKGFLDPSQENDLRRLATEQPTAWVDRYYQERGSLDENTRALVDRRAVEVSRQSLANLGEQGRTLPRTAEGAIDYSSDQAKTLKRNMERNIAVLHAARQDFRPADEAYIRGGFMPVGNRELTDRVVEQLATQPPAARPATEHDERMFRTQMNRIDGSEGGARKISNAQIQQLSNGVAHGWLTLQQAESVLLTGHLDPQARQVVQRDPKNDLIINGVVVERGSDPQAVAEFRQKAETATVKLYNDVFQDLFPGDEDWQVEERARRMNQFMTTQMQNRDDILARTGVDPLKPNAWQAATLANTFAAEIHARSEYDKGYLGLNPFLFGDYEEKGAPYSNERAELARELLPADWGVYTLGDKQFNATQARRWLMEQGGPEGRAAVHATMGDDAALNEYVQRRIQREKEGQ